MIDLTITRQMLGTVLQSWFHNIKNAEQAKAEILALFSEEPGDGYTWSEQDIWEQSRKGISSIMVSSELEELLEVCHRILIMHEGRIVKEIFPEDVTVDESYTLCMG